MLAAACEHSTPFKPTSYTPGEVPRDASGRLTYNSGADRTPAWSPDGSVLIYSRERLDRPDRDRCLAEMPPRGGTIQRQTCGAEPGDSTDVLDSPAISGGGRLAYVHASSRVSPPDIAPRDQALGVALVGQPGQFRRLVTTPYFFAQGQQTHDGIGHVRWAGDSTLVYVGQHVTYSRECSTCALDTLRWGADLVLFTWQGNQVTLDSIPGGSGASSVAVSSTGGGRDTLYYTRNGDSRVYRYARSTRVTDLVHDFGAAGIARDVTVAAGRLVAVVGGTVRYAMEPALGYVQRDAGGNLYAVDLATGMERSVAGGPRFYRRPALAPDGRWVVAEGFPVTVAGSDSVVAPVGDLWLLPIP